MTEQSDSTLDTLVETCLSVFGILQQRSVTDWIELDLSTAQLKVLFTVNFVGPLPISQLASMVGIGAPTASHLVEKLVQIGYLERIESSTDRRIVHAQITDKGREITQRLRQGRVEVMRHWIGQLPITERRTLQHSLSVLMQII